MKAAVHSESGTRGVRSSVTLWQETQGITYVGLSNSGSKIASVPCESDKLPLETR